MPLLQHWFLTVSRANNLSDNGSQRVLKDTDMNDFVKLSSEELEHLQTRYRVFIARHLKEHFPSFKNIDKHLQQKTSCSPGEDMSKKSDVITMPILLKDEKKYSDCVDVLDKFKDWVYNIYSAAGRCTTTGIINNEGNTDVGGCIIYYFPL